MSEWNCACPGTTTVVLVMGVERCAACNKLSGGDAFRTFGSPLPTRATRRRKVSAK